VAATTDRSWDLMWETLEEFGVVPRPKLPDVGKVCAKARERNCSVQVNYPSDENESVFVIVSRQGQQFSGEALKDVEAVAIALAACLLATEPRQLEFPEAETIDREPDPKPEPKKRKRTKKTGSVLEEAAAHLDAVGDDFPSEETDIPESAVEEVEDAIPDLPEGTDDYSNTDFDPEERVKDAGYDVDEVLEEAAEEDGYDGP